jgi:hypothetical protein
MALYSGHSSAGVYVKESNQSLRAANVPTSIGAIVGPAKQGPVMERTLVTSPKEFIELFGIPDPQLTFMHYAALAFLQEANRLYVTRVADEAVYGGVAIQIISNLSQERVLDVPISDLSALPFSADDIMIITGANPGEWNNSIQVVVYPKPGPLNLNHFVVEVRYESVVVEQFEVSLNHQQDGFGVQLQAGEHINRRSNYIKVFVNEDHVQFVQDETRHLVNTAMQLDLLHGGDGNDINDGHIMLGWDLYRNPEYVDVNILINGGHSSVAVQQSLSHICESRMDCIAVLDVPTANQGSADEMVYYRRNDLALNSTYAAIYGPDIFISDDYNGMTLYVPPSGHVAAAYARVDYEYAVWWAPAGMDNGRIDCLGVSDLYDLGDRNSLSENQVNIIRLVRGHGVRIFDASTLTSVPSALQNINVRRLMSYLEKSIQQTSLYGVFNPNDSVLRAKLRNIAEGVLGPIKSNRGAYAYDIVCSEENNPPEVIASGDTVLDVYVDPVLPSRRIHINAIVLRTGALKMSASYA